MSTPGEVPVISRLRRKFIVIVMVLVGLVLAMVLGASLYSMHASQDFLIEAALDRNLEGNIDSVPVIGGGEGLGQDGPDRTNMLALGVEISSEGVVLQTSDAPVNINAETLRMVIDEVLSSGGGSGEIPSSHVCWKAAETSDGSIRIAIVDTSAADANFHTQLVRDIEIIVVALACIFVIAWFLSGWALKPVSEAWDRQKRFIADASHELKTPLAVILANTDILSKDASILPESDARRWIESTAEEAGHMKGLVNDLLELARADEGAAGIGDVLKKEELDFSDLVSSAALEFDAVAFERGVGISEKVEPGITVHGDGEWLGRLVRILIDNAVKYAAVGSEVTVGLDRHGKAVSLVVNNAGETIPPEDLEHIFDRFYRSDKARTRKDGAGGFGLGLAIAKAITEAHGGTISCQSTDKGGTTFTVTL